MTNPTEPRIPSSLESAYIQRREAGQDHDRASAGALHAFAGGRRPTDPSLLARVDRARRSYDAEQHRVTAA